MGSKKSGRRLAYNAEIHAKIVEALRSGAYKIHAANAAGISRDTLDDWVAAGRAGQEPFVQFAIDVDQARAIDALRNQAIISAAATRKIEGDWKAAAWNLERKFPKLYGRRWTDLNADDNREADDLPDNLPAVHSPWLVAVK